MQYEDSHLSDQQLLLDVEGELSAGAEKLAQTHLEGCWKCRARRQAIENAIGDFVRLQQQEFEAKLPPIAGPRALLRARIAQLSAAGPRSHGLAFPSWFYRPLVAAAGGFLLLGLLLAAVIAVRQGRPHARAVIVSIPDSRLTPGAAILASRQAVCAEANPNNKVVPAALRRKVFEEYGISAAEPRAYEVDYLITPALGGAEDIRNLWPHSYSATTWNAQVKDALEVRLRQMVCGGSLDLTEAQRDIAGNWIAAYKKYFHTDKPLAPPFERSVQ